MDERLERSQAHLRLELDPFSQQRFGSGNYGIGVRAESNGNRSGVTREGGRHRSADGGDQDRPARRVAHHRRSKVSPAARGTAGPEYDGQAGSTRAADRSFSASDRPSGRAGRRLAGRRVRGGRSGRQLVCPAGTANREYGSWPSTDSSPFWNNLGNDSEQFHDFRPAEWQKWGWDRVSRHLPRPRPRWLRAGRSGVTAIGWPLRRSLVALQ